MATAVNDMKVTTPEDLALAELLAGDFRPASLLKLLDLGNLPELTRPEG